MDKKQIEKLVSEKVDAALKANDTPKKFFITENGRGVVDGVLSEVLSVMKTALVDIISEICTDEKPVEKTEKVEKAEKPAAKTAKK